MRFPVLKKLADRIAEQKGYATLAIAGASFGVGTVASKIYGAQQLPQDSASQVAALMLYGSAAFDVVWNSLGLYAVFDQRPKRFVINAAKIAYRSSTRHSRRAIIKTGAYPSLHRITRKPRQAQRRVFNKLGSLVPGSAARA